MIGFLARRRTSFFPISALVMVLAGRPTWNTILAGAVFVALGEAMRFWAAGHIRKSVELSVDGPFGCCRNPLYFGSFLMTVGFAIMANTLVLAIFAMVLFWALHGSAIACEERHLSCVFGDKFAEYCSKVPRIFPKLPRGGAGSFSFQLAVDNKEHVSTAFAIVIALAFALRV